MKKGLPLIFAVVILAGLPPRAVAEWRAGSADVTAAARDPEIAAVLAQVDRLDRATIDDDRAGFAALLAPDLVVNNPQNGISKRGGTAQRGQAGQISYSSYVRTIEHAGKIGDLVVLMGGEQVVAKGSTAPVQRRFTDLWRKEGAEWRLAARQATVIAPTSAK